MKKSNIFPIITAFVAVAIFYMIYSGGLSPVYLLLVLGALGMALGIYGIIATFIADADPENRTERSLSKPIMEILLGGLVLVIGLVEGMHIELPNWFWTAAFVLIIVIALIWLFVRTKNSMKK